MGDEVDPLRLRRFPENLLMDHDRQFLDREVGGWVAEVDHPVSGLFKALPDPVHGAGTPGQSMQQDDGLTGLDCRDQGH